MFSLLLAPRMTLDKSQLLYRASVSHAVNVRNGRGKFQGYFLLNLESQLSFQVNHEKNAIPVI